jgi:hypothetical protein
MSGRAAEGTVRMIRDRKSSMRWPWGLMVLTAVAMFHVQPVVADAALFQAHCAKCHARATTLARSLKGATVEEKTRLLETILATHHADDPATRAKLAAYLVSLTSK